MELRKFGVVEFLAKMYKKFAPAEGGGTAPQGRQTCKFYGNPIMSSSVGSVFINTYEHVNVKSYKIDDIMQDIGKSLRKIQKK